MPGLTKQELMILIQALSFYGQDLAKNGANTDTEKVLSLICEFSHYVMAVIDVETLEKNGD